jgi:hypothetical protein
VTLEPNTGDSTHAPDPGTTEAPSAEPSRAEPAPDVAHLPVFADAPAAPIPGTAAPGWAQPPPSRGPRPTRAPSNPIVLGVLWAISLAALGLLALGVVRIGNPGVSSSMVYAQAIGALLGSLGIGFVVVFLVDRVRASGGHAKVNWVWAALVAAVFLGSQLAGRAPIAVSASAPSGSAPTLAPSAPESNPPAQVYFLISKPFGLVPTTNEDATLVTQLNSNVGQGGLTDAKVERIVRADQVFAGYLIVVSGSGSGDVSGATTGLATSLAARSFSPDTTTVDGRSVLIYSVKNGWIAAWFEGHFFVQVFGHDRTSANTLAKAVLDAH